MVAGLVFASLLAQDPAAALSYEISVTERPERPQVAVTLRFDGEADGSTTLRLPGFWGGEGELWNVISGLTVEGGVIAAGDDPEIREVSHAPGAPLIVRYSVVPDRTGDPHAAAHDYYRPYVEADFIHLIGHTVFVMPDGADQDHPVEVTTSLPESWAYASDLEHGDLTLTTLGASIFVAGDFRIQSRTVMGADIRLAMRGDAGIEDAVFAREIETAVAANLDYWQTGGEPYIVTVLPMASEPGHMSIGGTNLGDAFAMFVTYGPDLPILTRTLSHEHIHSWNPYRLGGLMPGDQNEEAEGYWFSEGFTDFLTTRARVRGGSADSATTIAHINMILREDAESPFRASPNSVVGEQFWTDSNAQRLPYQRGEIFAMLIDHHIRTGTEDARDLDDVIAYMQETAEDGPAPTRFVSSVEAATGIDISDLFQRHIIDGEPVFLAADTYAACGVVETRDEPVYDYGMTGRRNEAGLFVIETVDENGPAWPAGFRPGMIVLERLEGAVGDASTDSVLRIRSEDGVEDLRYRATNGEVLRVQELVAAPGANEDTACTRQLSGENG